MSYKFNFIHIRILIIRKFGVAIQRINIYFTIIVSQYLFAKYNVYSLKVSKNDKEYHIPKVSN